MNNLRLPHFEPRKITKKNILKNEKQALKNVYFCPQKNNFHSYLQKNSLPTEKFQETIKLFK